MLVKEICAFITATVSVLMAYFAVYYVIGFLARTRAYPETDKRRRFAIITAARNEERVIGNLLKTLREQDYPASFSISSALRITARITRQALRERAVRTFTSALTRHARARAMRLNFCLRI